MNDPRQDAISLAHARAIVMLTHGDRVLLGNVTGFSVDGLAVRLLVRHFNGEPWPVSPAVADVEILER